MIELDDANSVAYVHCLSTKLTGNTFVNFIFN